MRIGVFGAGSIGCFVGGRLAAAGVDTVLVGRASLAAEVAAAGLRLTDCDGGDVRVAPAAVRFATAPSGVAAADAVLVTVKSQDTEASAAALRPHLGSGAVVVSLQNGVRNADVLRAGLPGVRVFAGMVPYNVLRKDGGAFHRGTSGALVLERAADDALGPLCRALGQAGLAFELRADVLGVQWGKLLVNTNNAINALAGLPLREQLAQRAFRRIFSLVMAEGQAVLAAAGIRPVSAMKVPAWVLPLALRLPDALFQRAGRAMLTIDPEARSSMWDDLSRRRLTEVDYLNGEIVRLASQHGKAAPLNAGLVALIRAAERASRGSPGLSAEALAAALGVAVG